MSVLQKLTEGIQTRNLQQEGDALLEKWERTGLLEGITDENKRQGMARLLENQAAQLLKESSSMAAGDVEGFASVAFPIVRRVFGGLIANDLVSVQPMSLPSGLIFFLDFQVSDETPKLDFDAGDSLYGGGVVASQLTGGVNLEGDNASKGAYNLNNGYASPTGSHDIAGGTLVVIASGSVGSAAGTFPHLNQAAQDKLDKLVRFDPDLSGSLVVVVETTGSTAGNMEQLNVKNLVPMIETRLGTTAKLVRRLTTVATGSSSDDPSTSNFRLQLTFAQAAGTTPFDNGAGTSLMGNLTGAATLVGLQYNIDDNFTASTAIGSVVGATAWELEANTGIPEIDIKVDSVAVTAMTKKLKAKWTPELGQDLNAYHNLDAEVELTSILSEQVALEIDQEILEDLVKGAKAGTYYWSRSPGLFVNRTTGAEIGASAAAPDFTGTVSEWYETLLETINDVSAQIHRKTLRGGANFVVCGPEVANVMEFTAGFRATVTADDAKGTIGAVKTGTLNNKWDVHVDPYFPRNVVLVGRRGSGFLESGYVYAPYVPLQVTPTIFGTEDFVPRKGVMTRYAKKMVRPDMYGLVIVRGLLGESGS
tara:strand:+ start:4114 stop:5889 length:1776 start_codon:yes stop_codon:yes gene_type:complete